MICMPTSTPKFHDWPVRSVRYPSKREGDPILPGYHNFIILFGDDLLKPTTNQSPLIDSTQGL
jgi:hypothetical protein